VVRADDGVKVIYAAGYDILRAGRQFLQTAEDRGEPAHRFSVWRIVRGSLGELDVARCEKIANTVEVGLTIHIEPVVHGDIEGTKCFASLRRALLKVLVKHLFQHAACTLAVSVITPSRSSRTASC